MSRKTRQRKIDIAEKNEFAKSMRAAGMVVSPFIVTLMWFLW